MNRGFNGSDLLRGINKLTINYVLGKKSFWSCLLVKGQMDSIIRLSSSLISIRTFLCCRFTPLVDGGRSLLLWIGCGLFTSLSLPASWPQPQLQLLLSQAIVGMNRISVLTTVCYSRKKDFPVSEAIVRVFNYIMDTSFLACSHAFRLKGLCGTYGISKNNLF